MNKLYDTPIKAMRKKCLDGTCGQFIEIRECPVMTSALYPCRMGSRPDQATIDILKAYYDDE